MKIPENKREVHNFWVGDSLLCKKCKTDACNSFSFLWKFCPFQSPILPPRMARAKSVKCLQEGGIPDIAG